MARRNVQFAADKEKDEERERERERERQSFNPLFFSRLRLKGKGKE